MRTSIDAYFLSGANALLLLPIPLTALVRPAYATSDHAVHLTRRYTPSKYVREYLAEIGSHERVVHIRVGDGAGPDGEGPCHVEGSRVNLSTGMAALQEAILDHWKVPLTNASSILLLSDCSEVYNALSAFSQPPWGWLHHSNVGASATELEQTWAEWLAMVNAAEIMHTPRQRTQPPIPLSV